MGKAIFKRSMNGSEHSSALPYLLQKFQLAFAKRGHFYRFSGVGPGAHDEASTADEKDRGSVHRSWYPPSLPQPPSPLTTTTTSTHAHTDTQRHKRLRAYVQWSVQTCKHVRIFAKYVGGFVVSSWTSWIGMIHPVMITNCLFG